MPANAGIQLLGKNWVSAFAGTSGIRVIAAAIENPLDAFDIERVT